MSKSETTPSVPAFIPPGTPDPKSHCYVCGGDIGVFAWTDCNGRAHPWCAQPEEKWRWEYSQREPLS
jgi:hypothetical protein